MTFRFAFTDTIVLVVTEKTTIEELNGLLSVIKNQMPEDVYEAKLAELWKQFFDFVTFTKA